MKYLAQASEEVLPLGQGASVTRGVLSPAKHILTITLILLLWEISRISKATDNLKVRIRALSEKTLENEEHPKAHSFVSCAPVLGINSSLSS